MADAKDDFGDDEEANVNEISEEPGIFIRRNDKVDDEKQQQAEFDKWFEDNQIVDLKAGLLELGFNKMKYLTSLDEELITNYIEPNPAVSQTLQTNPELKVKFIQGVNEAKRNVKTIEQEIEELEKEAELIPELEKKVEELEKDVEKLQKMREQRNQNK